MLVTLSGMLMLVTPQLKNAEFPISVSCEFAPKVMLVSPSQSENALSPMLVTPDGILMLVRFVQSENALSPMLVTLSGMIMRVRFVQ